MTVTAAEAIAYVHACTNGQVTLTPNRLRVWATRGHITRTDRGRYDLGTIMQRVREHVLAEQNKSL